MHSVAILFTVAHLHYPRFMLLFESIFCLSFCLVRQPSLYFTVSFSTDKGSEVTFYCQISILSDLAFSLESAVQKSLTQTAGKQLLFNKYYSSTFCLLQKYQQTCTLAQVDFSSFFGKLLCKIESDEFEEILVFSFHQQSLEQRTSSSHYIQ